VIFVSGDDDNPNSNCLMFWFSGTVGKKATSEGTFEGSRDYYYMIC